MAAQPIDNSRVTVVHNAHKPALAPLRFAELLRGRGIDVEVVVSDDAEQGDAAARRALDAGSTLIIASGGDGTVRSVLAAVAEAHGTLGVLPVGTANDLAHEVGVRNLDDAAQAVIAARATPWDVGVCTYQDERGYELQSAFCSTAGVGLIARALQMSQSRPGHALKRVLRNGVWAPLVTASAYTTRAQPCVLELDDVRVERTLMLLEISKLRATSGGIPITPDARGDSGMLHAWTVENPRKWEVAGILYDSFSGSLRQLKNKNVEYFSREPKQNRAGVSNLSRIAIESSTTPLPVHLNGDYVGTTPAVFELEASAFNVLIAPRYAGEAVRAMQRKLRGVAVPAAQA